MARSSDYFEGFNSQNDPDTALDAHEESASFDSFASSSSLESSFDEPIDVTASSGEFTYGDSEALGTDEEFVAEDGFDAWAQNAPVPIEATAAGTVLEANESAANPATPQVSDEERKRRKNRNKLIVIVVILALLVVGCAVGGVYLVMQGDSSSDEKQAQVSTDKEALQTAAKNDASTTTGKKVDVPALTKLVGLTQDEAVSLLGEGASVSASSTKSAAVKDDEADDEADEDAEDGAEEEEAETEVTVTLTGDSAGLSSSNPKVYLTLDADDVVKRAGYCVSTDELGYDAQSFVDLVNSAHVIENTLAEAGLSVEEGTVAAPSDSATYTTKNSSDTITKESYSFSGTAKDAANTEFSWEAILLYDYSPSNSTGTIADTLRQISVYVSLA